jgi:GT2 family glycosyltransferase
MAQWPSVTVIIVGFRSLRYLDRCLTSVLGQAFPGEVEVVFVDNASHDGSAEYVRQTFRPVTVVESGVNLGYAGGNNLGAGQARGEILVFLNPDTEAATGWLMPLVQPLLDDADVGLTTSKILLMDERETVNACGNDISLPGINWCRGFGLALLPGSSGDPADRQRREETASTEGNVGRDRSIRDLQVRLAGGPD